MFYLALVLSGGIGVLLRYLLSRATVALNWTWLPYGTLLANILGCFLMGYLSWMLVHKWRVSEEMQTLVLTGLLGGFTTFSAFSIETVTLFEQGFSFRFVLYIFASVLLCLSMTFLGLSLARQG